MCNDWVRQVDFDPAQTEFGVGAEGRVTCRQQFLQNSFNVTCRETAPGLFEWELGAHKCVREAQTPQRGGLAVAVAVPVVLVLVAAGALLLWFLLSSPLALSDSAPIPSVFDPPMGNLIVKTAVWSGTGVLGMPGSHSSCSQILL
ncbi:hypothetical protein UY3_00753 [Chelonia mydas]|uniref:Uncharacterized protein n=1 Tax=Chelonia mydas TaxID=8469 RepID=M7C1F1_CHEMY|nr:hypothetical protein UY3_00753 [Chelonia mydas]